MKKGQGLSLNTIIIAAIVLIVLIVLWAIFTGRMGTFTTGVKEQDDIATKKAGDFNKLAVGAEGEICDPGLVEVDSCKCVSAQGETCENGETCNNDGSCT